MPDRRRESAAVMNVWIECSRRDSNSDLMLRRHTFCPLNYGNILHENALFARLRNFTMREVQCAMHGVYCTIHGEGFISFVNQAISKLVNQGIGQTGNPVIGNQGKFHYSARMREVSSMRASLGSICMASRTSSGRPVALGSIVRRAARWVLSMTCRSSIKGRKS